VIELENLIKINQLNVEAADVKEFAGMLRAAEVKLKDAQISELSEDRQFSLAYGAAHALSLAALRWHGYRSENRYLVFRGFNSAVLKNVRRILMAVTRPRCLNLGLGIS